MNKDIIDFWEELLHDKGFKDATIRFSDLGACFYDTTIDLHKFEGIPPIIKTLWEYGHIVVCLTGFSGRNVHERSNEVDGWINTQRLREYPNIQGVLDGVIKRLEEERLNLCDQIHSALERERMKDID